MANYLVFDHTVNYEINLEQVLDELEDTLKQYPGDYLNLDRNDFESIESPVFWAKFWQSLAKCAAEKYQDELENPDTDDGFKFWDEDDNALPRDDKFPPSQYELNP